MTLPDIHTLYDVIAATWPSAVVRDVGRWTIRQGNGGGSRVSSATLNGAFEDDDIDAAEAAMLELGQPRQFMIRDGDDALDAVLDARGYLIKDPSVLYAARAEDVATQRPPKALCFTVWPPLAAQLEVWAEGGIGHARVDVMQRATDPKVTLLGRLDEAIAGTVFVGIHGDCAMIHALEIPHSQRRKGVAAFMTRGAAYWALDHGATYLTLVTTRANDAANALYTSLGMTLVGGYHYRHLP